MFSMRISRNENYSRWVHEIFEHVQNFRTDLPKLHPWEEHCPNALSLSLSLPKWPGMTRNDHPYKLEWSIRPQSAVDSAQWDWGIIAAGLPPTMALCCSLDCLVSLLLSIAAATLRKSQQGSDIHVQIARCE